MLRTCFALAITTFFTCGATTAAAEDALPVPSITTISSNNSFQEHREEGRRWVEQAETAYARFFSGWNPGPKRLRTGAANEE
ncbi:hypothetical protein [Mesorhizobium sp. M0771]|uniref:hypothetical protein n=1 Tax=Mesorhizobium sp. M0771 TaxID=2956997 RepID=UPI00333C03C9